MIKMRHKDLGLAPKPRAPEPKPEPVIVPVIDKQISERLDHIEQLLALMGNAVPDMIKRALTTEIKALVSTKPPVRYNHTVVRHYEPDGPIKQIVSVPVKPH